MAKKWRDIKRKRKVRPLNGRAKMEMGRLELTHHVLDDGFIRLDRHSGTDLDVVNHARISLAEYRDAMALPDEKLIHYLMGNRHGTPFESVFFSFHVRAPIFVARQWMRHRIASYNEISGRYTEMKDKFYTPEGSFVRKQVGKQGEYKFEEMDDHEVVSGLMRVHAEQAYNSYIHLLNMGVAKEVARMILPTSLYTEFYFDVNARSLMNFISQRNHEHAQMEMREYAKKVEESFAIVAPIAYQAFVDNGRITP